MACRVTLDVQLGADHSLPLTHPVVCADAIVKAMSTHPRLGVAGEAAPPVVSAGEERRRMGPRCGTFDSGHTERT